LSGIERRLLDGKSPTATRERECENISHKCCVTNKILKEPSSKYLVTGEIFSKHARSNPAWNSQVQIGKEECRLLSPGQNGIYKFKSEPVGTARDHWHKCMFDG